MKERESYSEKFKRFNIDVSKAPTYSGPEDYANKIKKCTLLTYGEVSYSSTSSNILSVEDSKGC